MSFDGRNICVHCEEVLYVISERIEILAVLGVMSLWLAEHLKILLVCILNYIISNNIANGRTVHTCNGIGSGKKKKKNQMAKQCILFQGTSKVKEKYKKKILMMKQNIHGDVSVGYAHIISIFPSYHFQFPLPQHPVLQLRYT